MKDMETDILKNVYIVGNPVLEAALKKFNEEMDQGEPNIVPVFDLMVEQMKEDVEVICPVNFPDGLPVPDEKQLAEDGSCEESVTMIFQKLDGDDDTLWMVAFTSEPESTKAPKSSSIPILLKDLFKFVLDEECDGIIINPFGNSISIMKEGVAAMLNLLKPSTQDEIDLDAGAEAYNRGDYAEAIELYTKSAAAGNVTALSNLGYCYYYYYNEKEYVDMTEDSSNWKPFLEIFEKVKLDVDEQKYYEEQRKK